MGNANVSLKEDGSFEYTSGILSQDVDCAESDPFQVALFAWDVRDLLVRMQANYKQTNQQIEHVVTGYKYNHNFLAELYSQKENKMPFFSAPEWDTFMSVYEIADDFRSIVRLITHQFCFFAQHHHLIGTSSRTNDVIESVLELMQGGLLEILDNMVHACVTDIEKGHAGQNWRGSGALDHDVTYRFTKEKFTFDKFPLPKMMQKLFSIDPTHRKGHPEVDPG